MPYKGSSGRQILMPTRRLLARSGMPQTKANTCSSSQQLVQRSLWFGGFKAKHWLRAQDTDNRRGQPFARNSTGVRGRPFGRSTSGRKARGCAPAKTPTTICTIWIAAGTISTHAIHLKAPRIRNTRKSSSKPFPRSSTVFVKPTSRGETSVLPTSAAMAVVIYADNLSCSESSKVIAGNGAAMQVVSRDRTSVLCHYCDQFEHFKRQCPLRINTSSSSGSSLYGIISNNNMVNISKSCPDGGRTTMEAAEAVCGVHITRQRPITTPTAVSKSTKPAATLMWPLSKLSASKESAAPTTYPRRMTSQNASPSPSRQPRYKSRQSHQRRPGRRTYLAVWSTDSGPSLAVRGA